MANHAEMMILPVEKRRAHFRKAYTIELGRFHATGACRWSIEKLPEMVERVMDGIGQRRVPSGPAYDATIKFFGITTQKALFAFLEY
jgi:hypothetical protein